MTIIRLGLITDGSSDRALIPIITLLLKKYLQLPYEPIEYITCDTNDLPTKVLDVANKYSLDILFIHRDSENESWEKRNLEIQDATPHSFVGRVIPVIPIKMTETWLLTDAKAICNAVGNPNSVINLALPTSKQLEKCAAKTVLLAALTSASELGTKRRRKFRPEQFRHIVAELTVDLTLLRRIPSFQRLEDALRPLLNTLNQTAPLPAHVEI